MKIHFVSDAPGSHGECLIDVTDAEHEFLRRLVDRFNVDNPQHAAPSFTITALTDVGETTNRRIE